MTHTLHDYAGQIRGQGFRMTPQRELILDAVCAGRGHTTIDEIYERLHARAPAINRSTVYRTLEFLRAMRLVVAAEIDGRWVYEIAHDQPHHHLHCQVCGDDTEISQEFLATAFAAIGQEHGFRIDTDHLVLKGTCRCCQNRPAQTSSTDPASLIRDT